MTPADDDLVTLAVTDDGCGFAHGDGPTAGSGLRIMRYRAKLIGARLTIGPAEPHGTRVVCTLGQRGRFQA